jgi:hypothetical protein
MYRALFALKTELDSGRYPILYRYHERVSTYGHMVVPYGYQIRTLPAREGQPERWEWIISAYDPNVPSRREAMGFVVSPVEQSVRTLGGYAEYTFLAVPWARDRGTAPSEDECAALAGESR